MVYGAGSMDLLRTRAFFIYRQDHVDLIIIIKLRVFNANLLHHEEHGPARSPVASPLDHEEHGSAESPVASPLGHEEHSRGVSRCPIEDHWSDTESVSS